MASRINYTVSVTGINTIPAQENDYREHDIVDAQLGGSVAAQVTLLVANPNETNRMVLLSSLTGYTYSAQNRYAEVTPAGKIFGETLYPKLLYVRNTGRAFVLPDKLGAAVDETVIVRFLYAGVDALYLKPGQAVVLPLHDNLVLDESVYVGNAAKVQLRTMGASNVAVEAFVLA